MPAWTMRRSEGECMFVRRARRERRVLIEVFEGMVSGIAAKRVSSLLALLVGEVWLWWCRHHSEARNHGRLGLTVAAGDGLNEDLHGLFRL